MYMHIIIHVVCMIVCMFRTFARLILCVCGMKIQQKEMERKLIMLSLAAPCQSALFLIKLSVNSLRYVYVASGVGLLPGMSGSTCFD